MSSVLFTARHVTATTARCTVAPFELILSSLDLYYRRFSLPLHPFLSFLSLLLFNQYHNAPLIISPCLTCLPFPPCHLPVKLVGVLLQDPAVVRMATELTVKIIDALPVKEVCLSMALHEVVWCGVAVLL